MAESVLYSPSAWPLQKYARLRESKEIETSTPNENKWAVFCSENGDLTLNLTATLQLVITKGNVIMESVFMPNAKRHVYAIAKGDSVLFLCKNSSGTRQFRIKFEESDGRSGIEQCSKCTQKLYNYINFKTDQTKISNVPNNLANEVSVGKVAQAILEPTKYVLPTAYGGRSEDISEEGLRDAIAFCLADPTFPSFVAAVEECLVAMTNDGDSSQESTRQSSVFTS